MIVGTQEIARRFYDDTDVFRKIDDFFTNEPLSAQNETGKTALNYETYTPNGKDALSIYIERRIKTPIPSYDNSFRYSEKTSRNSTSHKLTQNNGTILNIRRKSCCCALCGGLSHLEQRTQDINVACIPIRFTNDVKVPGFLYDMGRKELFSKITSKFFTEAIFHVTFKILNHERVY